MAYKKSSSCGGLRYSTTDFTEVDGVLTAAGNSELVGDPFLASMCGGIWFDDGVFGEVGKVITTAGTSSVASSFAANCSLLFDASKFELGDDKEIKLLQTEKLPISWDGNTVGKEVATMTTLVGGSTLANFYKVSTNVFNRDDIINTTITLSNGQTIDLTEETTQEGKEGWLVIDNDYCAVSGDYIISAKAGTYPFENVAIAVVPSDGIYFVSNDGVYVASLAETV